MIHGYINIQSLFLDVTKGGEEFAINLDLEGGSIIFFVEKCKLANSEDWRRYFYAIQKLIREYDRQGNDKVLYFTTEYVKTNEEVKAVVVPVIVFETDEEKLSIRFVDGEIEIEKVEE